MPTTPQTELLNQLHDIVLPPAVGWWPLAFSWWVLIFSVLSMLVGVIWFFLDRHKRNAYRREALALLNAIERNTTPPQQKIADINRLLKQVALTAYGRSEVAALTDQAWCEFLQHNAHYIQQPSTLLACLNMAYQPIENNNDADNANASESQTALHTWQRYARQWILGHHQ
jgi:cbb3-type cytochrome oxidase subunit 3